MAMNILSSNSGTTFLRLGGTNKIKIKSNLAWTFKLLPLNDENDIEAVKIQTAMTEDEEIISTLVGTGSTYDNIKWINIVNDLGNGVKEITGQGTTYLDIRADENFEGKDLFAVGYAEAITEPNICDFTVFEQYGKSYYFAIFNNEETETETQYIVRTPSEIEPSDTYVPVEIYTNTRCKVTISGIDSSSDTGEEFIIGTGVTKTGYPDESFEFKFQVPKNKTAESIVYTLRATSLEDPAFSQTYKVTHKGIEPKIILYPGEQSIDSDQTTFTLNYHIQPLTLAVDLGIFKQNTLVEVKHVSNSSTVTVGGDDYYEGAITYNCGKNEGGIDYQISGQTIGETFQVMSETNNPNIGTTALVHFQNYFEMIYGSQRGTSINVSGVDGDSGGKYDVSVHTNYPYTGFSANITGGNLINDCAIIPVGDNYFTVEFNVKINKESSRNGSITVTNGIVSGVISVSQGGGSEPPTPTYDFYWTDSRVRPTGQSTGTLNIVGSSDEFNIGYTTTYPQSSLVLGTDYPSDITELYHNGSSVHFKVTANPSTSSVRTMNIYVGVGGSIGTLTVRQGEVAPNTYTFVFTSGSVIFDGTSARYTFTDAALTKVTVKAKTNDGGGDEKSYEKNYSTPIPISTSSSVYDVPSDWTTTVKGNWSMYIRLEGTVKRDGYTRQWHTANTYEYVSAYTPELSISLTASDFDDTSKTVTVRLGSTTITEDQVA